MAAGIVIGLLGLWVLLRTVVPGQDRSLVDLILGGGGAPAAAAPPARARPTATRPTDDDTDRPAVAPGARGQKRPT